MWLEKFSEKPIHFKTWFLFELLEIHLNNKKNMIELIESMEELLHQKKSNWTIKYVVDKILERIILNIYTV